jgi:hypothetical protein
MSFCGAKPMDILAVSVREFDTQMIIRGVKITKENKVVVGFQLCSVPESVRRGAGSKKSWIRICRIAL